MNTPRVSVLVTTHNRKALLPKAIESVLKQSLSDWELVIVDDGSTDGTAAVARAFAERDRRIKYLEGDRVGRIAVVSNRGLAAAQGAYVAILDDDDYWIDDRKLEKQVAFLEKNQGYVGCGGGMIAVDEAGKELFRFLKPESDGEIRAKALVANPMANSTTLFRKSTAERIGFYDKNLVQFADWDFWLKIGAEGKLYNFREYFTAYRMWNKGSSFVHQKENAQSALIIVRRYRKIYPGFARALLMAWAYRIYVFLPVFLRRFLNPILSSRKKKVFSERTP